MTASWPAILLIVAAPFVGSFLGVLIHRLPAGRPIALSRSKCDHCAQVLSAGDMIPVISWLLLRGRCRACGARIDSLYPAVEVVALGIALWSLAVVPGWLAWPSSLLGWALLSLALIDLRHLLLPDALTLPLVLMGLAVAWWADVATLWSHAGAAVLGYAVVSVLRWAYWRLRGKEGIGLGDAKLMAAAGAWVGLAGFASVLLLAGVLGLAFFGARHWTGHAEHGPEIPFGPSLAAAFWVTWLYGPVQLA